MSDDELNEVEFFKVLLAEIKTAYESSDVCQKFGRKLWGYNATVSRLVRNTTVIVGFNGGVDSHWISKGNVYGPQVNYPVRNFGELYDELGSLKRTIPYFDKFHPVAKLGVQINYCFFNQATCSKIWYRDFSRMHYRVYPPFIRGNTGSIFATCLMYKVYI